MLWSDPEVIAAVVAGIGAVVAAIVAGLRTLFKKTEEILSQFKPNGGSSLRDQMDKLEQRHESLEQKVDLIFDLIKNKFEGK